ncbi:mRNA turnover protein 4 [Galdieria sulphuraria]|uniref:Ribosome assembly factor mrt4 n=1 Tax=Galdieria sulphuraria TaxID=130081 RepID=M2XWC3_GALSU|nr:60S acidic ribosomal protein PO [Galdieria sulphuraria]EME27734.1 60S acidic ribosomal protein PO [Galdieria sulphuraria]GJD10144.1 mRNA turnover protein 4 [Galdieria sulphuraria]|eukprot:XP_005704254.1 60S acidic ribosomal protein PO [Galdieria sulphuraria]
MPTSRRRKNGIIKKQAKNRRQSNADIIEAVTNCLQAYKSIYILNFDCIRSSIMKELRNNWKDSRFFFGKNKVMRYVLGKTEEEEPYKGLHQLAPFLSGNIGVLFTSRTRDQVHDFFDNFIVNEYPRIGSRAPRDVVLNAGPVDIPVELEPRLRELGLPIQVQNNEIFLTSDVPLFQENSVISRESAKILETLCMPILEARVEIVAEWDSEFGFSANER